jgi:hypothetical protein
LWSSRALGAVGMDRRELWAGTLIGLYYIWIENGLMCGAFTMVGG